MTPRIDVSRIADGGSVIRCYHTMVKAMEAICHLDCTYCYNMHKKNPCDLQANGTRLNDD